MNVRIIHNITKEYPDMYKIIIYKEPQMYVEKEYSPKKHRSDEEPYEPKGSSLYRTRTLIKDIILSNDFELFCTFTFDPTKTDRFNYNQCLSRMRIWIHHQKTKAPDLKYLFIPEQHKNGAWHFHALISNYKGTLKKTSHKSATGREVYNMTSYRSGFTTAVKIDNKDAVAHYVSKYITKSFIKKFNRKRFFCSQNLKRPIKTINSPVFSQTLPIFRRRVHEGYETDTFIIDRF